MELQTQRMICDVVDLPLSHLDGRQHQRMFPKNLGLKNSGPHASECPKFQNSVAATPAAAEPDAERVPPGVKPFVMEKGMIDSNVAPTPTLTRIEETDPAISYTRDWFAISD